MTPTMQEMLKAIHDANETSKAAVLEFVAGYLTDQPGNSFWKAIRMTVHRGNSKTIPELKP